MPRREVNAAVSDAGVFDAAVFDAVVFDIGGVLLDWDPRHLYRRLFDDPDEMAGFLATVCTRDWHREHDLGVDTQQSCQRLARQHPAYADMIMAWADRGEEMIAGQIDGTVQVLAELKAAGLPCFALSNMEPDTYAVRRDRFAFMQWFDGCVISGIEGVAKPDRRIFDILVDRHGLDPGRTVFIDDSPGNVTAARAAGIEAIRFVSPEALRSDLRGLGLAV
jgi:2-haloacid dehalogenase